MSLDRTTRGDVHVLVPRKNLTGGAETTALLAAVDEVAAAGAPKVVVDLSKISFMSSIGLGSLVKAHTTCVNRGGWLRMTGIGARIENIMLVTRLTFVFDTYETVDKAIAGASDGKA
jgi:anti-anti-sigma factor